MTNPSFQPLMSPDDPPLGDGVFGLETPDDAAVRLLPVPFEMTTSYGHGASEGPGAIFEASPQLDLRDRVFGDVWSRGIAWQGTPKELPGLMSVDRGDLEAVNTAGERVCEITRAFVKGELEAGRVPGVIGGEHSISLGGILAAADAGEIGVLQIDAHHDLRKAYEGYEHSHASVMYNALERGPNVSLVAVGIRDYCREEDEYAKTLGDRVRTFYDAELASESAIGTAWIEMCREIVAALPERVWVTFDIDGLEPSLCPGTGTPVPGGLSFREACVLLRVLAESGKRVVGFDLVEVAPCEHDGEWNGNVGARVLYQLCGSALVGRA